MSLGSLFCDRPNLTPSNNKLFIEIRQTSTAASKKAVNGTYAKYYPSTAFFCRALYLQPSIDKFHSEAMPSKQKYAATRVDSSIFHL